MEMIPETVIGSEYTGNRNVCNSDVPACVIAPPLWLSHPVVVLTTVELIARLDERGIRNADIARALKVSPSRVTEIKKGERAIKLDEAAKLVVEFDLESGSSQKVPPLPGRIARLIVLYIAAELDHDSEENRERIEELSEDVRAFAEFVADPRVRESAEAAEAFFQAMRLRRPTPARAD
jgi:transcriptional regulator with XRE-family HTH domain